MHEPLIVRQGPNPTIPAGVHEPDELLRAIDELHGDGALRARLDAMSRRLQATPGTAVAADVLERVVNQEPSPTGEGPIARRSRSHAART
jgi:hypothetical protein